VTNDADKKAEIIAHYNDVAATYDQQYDPANLYTLEKYPANYFRLQNLLTRLMDSDAKRIYEVGTGEGTPITAMAKAGFEVAGCDISENMVDATRNKMEESGFDPHTCQIADIENASSFSNQLTGGQFDALIAFGVLPHVIDDVLALKNMHSIVHSGGKVFIEFRNKLFSLFTLNRNTKEFFMDDLLDGIDCQVRDAVAQDLDTRLALEMPPRRLQSARGELGYDAIQAKFHNPFTIPTLFDEAGLKNLVFHWYHFHAAPPMLESDIGAGFRQESIKLEGRTDDWRGFFLCSAGVIEADVCD
tara:strand:- start:212 stop:1117 length:906 start_codon:yes stop_codon:yes gene_type:complete